MSEFNPSLALKLHTKKSLNSYLTLFCERYMKILWGRIFFFFILHSIRKIETMKLRIKGMSVTELVARGIAIRNQKQV